MRIAEKLAMVVVGVVPLESALEHSSGYCFTYNVTDATGHVLRTTTACTHPAVAGLPIPIVVVPAIAAVVVYGRLSQRGSAASRRATVPCTHDRSEAQAVEIVLALVLAASACVSVVVVSRVFQHLVGAAGGSGWSTATAVLATCAGLAALLDQLVHPRQTRNALDE